ncbi:MAG TPA: hypothetical protein VFC63_07290 [Blastocatellia bacterium]|nr:hypothetical protein [Blastocatellia bacterium]
MNCNEANELIIAAKDGKPEDQSSAFKAHVKECSACSQLMLVSNIRQELVSSYSDEKVAVPPFFAAKVMAAINEKRNVPDEWTWIWQIARRMVPAALAVMVMVAVFTFGFSPNGQVQSVGQNDQGLISLSSEYNRSLVGTDGQSSIMTSTGDLPADSVLSTVMGINGGRTNNE